MDIRPQQIRPRLAAYTDDELRAVLHASGEDFTAEALEIARTEAVRRGLDAAAPAAPEVPRVDPWTDFVHCAECGAALPEGSRYCQQCEAGQALKTTEPGPARRLCRSAWRFAALSGLVIEAAPLALWQAFRAWRTYGESQTRDTLLARRIRRALFISAGFASLSAFIWFFYLTALVKGS